jgi:hypothetical protein
MAKHIKRLALRALTLAIVLQAFIYYDGVWHLVG